MLLAELVDKSLLQPVQEFEQLYGARYKLLETIREHAYAGLSSQGDDLIEFRDRTVAWCSTYVGGLEGAWSRRTATGGTGRRMRTLPPSRWRWSGRPSSGNGTWLRGSCSGSGSPGSTRRVWPRAASGGRRVCADNVADKEVSGRLLAIAGRLSNLTGDVRAARRHYGEARTLIPPRPRWA